MIKQYKSAQTAMKNPLKSALKTLLVPDLAAPSSFIPLISVTAAAMGLALYSLTHTGLANISGLTLFNTHTHTST